jgi:hypothetical protein
VLLSSSNTVEYVKIGNGSANRALRRMHSRKNVRLSITAMKPSTFAAAGTKALCGSVSSANPLCSNSDIPTRLSAHMLMIVTNIAL